MTLRRTVGAAAVCLVAVVTACAGGSGQDTLTVFAAASLTDAFAELAAEFEASESGIAVEVSVGGSSALREQILAGAPADVFAAADRIEIDRLVDAGAAVGEPVVFATNRLALVVPEGNPAGVSGLEDLARTGFLVGLCAAEVPCGRLAHDALSGARVEAAVDTEAPDVRSLLTQVAAGELDAGLVYQTDALAVSAEVDSVPLGTAAIAAGVPIVVVEGADDPAAADAFVRFVASGAGQRILASHGFGGPP